jgi:preprotein translocase subunit YajC
VGSLVILAVMFGALYIFMILPQQRRVKAHKALLEGLEEGDVVMTNSGIYGAIAEIEGEIVWLEVAPEVELKILKSSIADREPSPSDDDASDDDDDASDDDASHDDAAEGDTDDSAAELAEKGDEG